MPSKVLFVFFDMNMNYKVGVCITCVVYIMTSVGEQSEHLDDSSLSTVATL
jgi:hypothetical protein